MTPTRDETRQVLRDGAFDVLVIGAGITGAGIALDAAARGLSVAVLDKGDVASGTSGWSTKLVHGGVRYLEQYDFPMVREGLHERYTLLQNAPYLVRRLGFLYPVAGGLVAKTFVDTGLWFYDLLAGRRSLGLHHRVDAATSTADAPLRAPWDRGGFLYYDGQTDDTRLTLTILLSAVERGAVVATYTEVVGFLKDGGRVTGVRARDALDGGDGAAFEVKARAVINATGVWMDRLQTLDDPDVDTRVVPSKGSHIVVPAARLPIESAVIMPKTSDGRVLFAVPWQGRVVIGTTDAEYTGDLDCPTATTEDVAYILRHANEYFGINLTENDIVATYAGLRPLIRAGGPDSGGVSGGQDPGGRDKPGGAETEVNTKDVSRKHIVVTSPSGLVSIGGGKLTTYRVMAHDAVEAALKATDLTPPHAANTAHIPLTGTLGYRRLAARADELATRYSVTPDVVRHLLGRYGAHATRVLDTIAERPELTAPLVEGLPYLQAEAIYSARHELVTTLEDILARRTRLLLIDDAHGVDIAEATARLVAPELGWDDARIAAEAARYRDYARRAASGYSHGAGAQADEPAAAAV